MMIAMIIIAIAACALLPVLTTAKPRIETTALRGQFGCFYEDSNLKQWKFDERTSRTNHPEPRTGNCVLRFDQRPAYFYVVAVGAGSSSHVPGLQDAQGQVVTKYTPALSDTLTIEVPKANTASSSVVWSSASAAEVTAGSGAQVPENGLNGANIKSCRYYAGKPCATSCKVQWNYKTNEYVVQFYGCETLDAAGNPSTEGSIIPLNDFKIHSSTRTINTAQNTTDNNAARYTTDDGVSVNFELIDSMYTKNEYIVGLNNLNKSRFVQVLESISGKRRSKLTELMRKADFGNIDKDGAVLILW